MNAEEKQDFVKRFVVLYERWIKVFHGGGINRSPRVKMEYRQIDGRLPFDKNGEFTEATHESVHPSHRNESYLGIIFRYGNDFPTDIHERSLSGPFSREATTVLIALGIFGQATTDCGDWLNHYTIRVKMTDEVYRRLPPLLPPMTTY